MTVDKKPRMGFIKYDFLKWLYSNLYSNAQSGKGFLDKT